MKLGFRVFDKNYLNDFSLDFVQISIWHQKDTDFDRVFDIVQSLKRQRRRYVIHPACLFLSETRERERNYNVNVLKEYARISDMGLIIHDETLPWGGKLEGRWIDAYKDALAEIGSINRVSIENASCSNDAIWFWEIFADSITFDIGHFEAAGMDCYRVIESLSSSLMEKIDFVHLHRNNGMKDIGITDHWPLERNCEELYILKRLLKLRPDINVVLEVDGREDIRKSLEVLSRVAY